LDEFAWATVGRQMSTPLLVSNVAPDRLVSNEYISVCAGESESIAVQATDRFTPTLMAMFVPASGE